MRHGRITAHACCPVNEADEIDLTDGRSQDIGAPFLTMFDRGLRRWLSCSPCSGGSLRVRAKAEPTPPHWYDDTLFCLTTRTPGQWKGVPMPSRPLPARPNLEHLKNQAKDLLKAYRAGQPSAFKRFRESLPRLSGASVDERPSLSLRDAQHVVAAENGFTS